MCSYLDRRNSERPPRWPHFATTQFNVFCELRPAFRSSGEIVPMKNRLSWPKTRWLHDRRVRLLFTLFSCLADLVHPIRALFRLSPARYFSHLQALYHWSNPGSSNVWRVTCGRTLTRHSSPPSSFHRLTHSEMSSPAPQAPCRLFRSKDGCRYGKKCKFAHDLGSTSGTRTPQSSDTPSLPTSATPRNRSGRSGNTTPRNVCDFYWNTGQCNRGFDCTFRHQKNTAPQPSSANVADGVGDEEDAANEALEFFTMDNLTQMAGVGLHSTQEGTPENAHNSIKRYLGGGSLNNPTEMKPLISILASVNRRNHSWVRVVHRSRQMDANLAADGG